MKRVLVLFILGVVCHLQAQTEAVSIRDAVALSEAQAIVKASGIGTDLNVGIEAAGHASFNWAGNETSVPAMVWSVGTSNFRMDGQLKKGIHSLRILDRIGNIQSTNGRQQRIDWTSTALTSNPLLPTLELEEALQDQSTSIRIFPTSAQDPSQIAILVICKNPDTRSSESVSKIYFVNAAHSVVATREILFGGRPDAAIRDYRYSDFREIDGLTIATTLSEYVGNQRTWTLQLSTVSVRANTPSDIFKF